MHSRLIRKHYFGIGLIAVCLLYLCFELFFNAYAIFSVDDFWFAHATYKYKNNLPYRDFAPYKTVLGYYLLLLPMIFTQGPIHALIYLKNSIALINTLVFLCAAFWLRRFFPKTAILCSLLLLTMTELVLSYSTNIRVDLFAYWFCLFSLLLLLEKRFFSAGILLGFGFMTSQKVIWYIFASNFSLFFSYFVIARQTKIFADLLKFNFAVALTIGIYLFIWAQIADWHTVLHSVFYEASAMYYLDAYSVTRLFFWTDITKCNPLFFLLLPITLIFCFTSYTEEHNYARRIFVTIFATCILFFLLIYKQVFPYYMQALFPLALLLYAEFFTWLLHIFRKSVTLQIYFIKQTGLWFLILIYIACFIFLKIQLGWPFAYSLICMIPLLIGVCYSRQKRDEYNKISLQLILITFIFVGLIYPMILYGVRLQCMNGSYQKANLIVVNHLLQKDVGYVAGVDLLYDKTQAIAGLRHLMYPAIIYLNTASPKLRAVMLPSLDEDPEASIPSIINALKQSNVKFFVNNYRIMFLPNSIKAYLVSQYEHFWGSIYLYAPQISAGRHEIEIKFSGNYMLKSTKNIRFAGKNYLPNTYIYINRGKYISYAQKPYRLKLMPELATKLNPQFAQDNWLLLVS